MKKHFYYLLVSGLIILMGCQKELSFEASTAPASGSLQDDGTGDCLPKTVNGVYEVSKALLPASNTVTVSVNVSKTGSYTITTDTVNGYFFRATGNFTTLGANNVTLRGNGTPFATGINNFVVSFDSTFCDFQVTVQPPSAAFTIVNSGSPASCSGATAAGSYIIGSPLTASSTVTLNVNVTTIGSYNVTTTAVNGMTFSSGPQVFSVTGAQTITLTGSGTPTGTPGTVTIPVTGGSSTCSFQVTTVASAAYTIDCSSAVVNGIYKAGVALDASNTVDITLNVTSTGPYSITTVTNNGMTFTKSGTFASTGSTTITLAGSGTPATSGTFNISIGTPPCTFPVQVVPAVTVDWKFTVSGITYQGTTDDALMDNSSPPITILYYSGSNVTDFIDFGLIDLAGGINNGETYNSASQLTNSAAFDFTGATETFTADPINTPSVSLIFTVTSHNAATLTITGTFAGTVKDGANATRTLTGGQFTAVYHF